MTVIKRDGTQATFDERKIRIAIQKANKEVPETERASEEEIEEIIQKAKEKDNQGVEEIQDIVEEGLMKQNHYRLSKSYMLYRYVHQLVRDMNETDESILGLIRYDNTETMMENSNKNPLWASTQRDLIAGEVSKDISKRLLLPKEIVEAHEKGVLHFHDMDYFIQQIFNCCLINISDMLDNGTIMNGNMIERPKSFQVACTVATQIITSVASGQYGGQSVNISHLGKYLRYSRLKCEKNVKKACPSLSKEQVDTITNELVEEEVRAGIQTIQYQLNTIMTTNGQTPFVTLFLFLDDNDPYEEEVAIIIKEILRQRIEGIKNEKGVPVTITFPKLVYVLDENNNLNGGKYDDITRLALKCSAKRMYPDYISAKKMRETYEGSVFSPMGCVSGDSVIKVRIDGNDSKLRFDEFWSLMKKRFKVRKQHEYTTDYLYIDTPDGVEIYDNKIDAFVKNLRLIRNISYSWREVKLSNENGFATRILATEDHPFEVLGKGIVQARNLKVADEMLVTNPETGKLETAKVLSLELTMAKQFSYDVTTESEHFEVNGVWSHNCRSFLSPWKDEDGNYKWEGRFNQGVVSINLPQIGIVAKGDKEEFYRILDERLELCREALMCRHEALLGMRSDISPIHWQAGAIARLKKGEVIDEYLKGGYSTLSLGYIGMYETTKLMLGVSHTTLEGEKFALELLQYLKDKVLEWKEESGLGFALYGTPAESLCYTFAEKDREQFGDIPDITDKGYYTNSYHVDVREPIDAFTKLKFEAQFQKISTGGCISYIEIPNMEQNLEVLETLVRFIYDNIQYAEFNTKSDYCMKCGWDGEIVINDDNEWVCPCCGNKDQNFMSVTRRTCGYLGANFWNKGKTQEIKLRVEHL